jgi:hypothetical protein
MSRPHFARGPACPCVRLLRAARVVALRGEATRWDYYRDLSLVPEFWASAYIASRAH